MADNDKLKMKFKLHQLEFEGNQEVVKEQFENFKSFITEDLLPKVNVDTLQTPPQIEEGQLKQIAQPVEAIVIDESGDIPALKEVVLRDLPKTETDWILVYACYSASFGQGTFTEEDVKNHYEQTGRKNRSRLANLSNNIKSLLNKQYIKVHNDTEYLVKPEGIAYAHEILKGKSTTKTTTKTPKKSTETKASSKSTATNSKKSSTTGKSFTLDRQLNLRPENKESLKDFATAYQTDSAPKRILVIVFYLKEILKMDSVGPNHIYTGFDELDLRVPKSLYQLISAAKNKNGWLDFETMDDIGLSIQGRNAIKYDLKAKSE